MYDDAPDTPLDELDARVPLSIAHWHRHVKWCLPPRGQPQRWRETTDGHPVFGPKSPIAPQPAPPSAAASSRTSSGGWCM
jgi:hypothetical protein